MSQRLKLDSSFYIEEAVVFGLVSQIPAYRLCFFLNQKLNLKLTRTAEDKILLFKKKQLFYTRFEFADEKNGTDWFLISNKNALVEQEKLFSINTSDEPNMVISGIPLIPSLKVMDYFFGYFGDSISSINSVVNSELKELSYVSTFQKIDINSTKNIDNLLIE